MDSRQKTISKHDEGNDFCNLENELKKIQQNDQ